MNSILFLAEWAIRSSLLVMVAALLLRAFRVRDAATRSMAWVAVLFASLAIPALTVALPSMPLSVMRSVPPAALAIQSLPPIQVEAQQAAPLTRAFDWERAAVAGYFVVAAALFLRLLLGLALTLRLLGGSRRTEIEGVRESEAVSAPVTLGILRPAIVLPADWRGWDRAKLEAVLAHERSHIERRDPAVQLVSSIHQALLWHSPLSWFLNRKIVRIAEEASDDAAIAATRDRALYAEVLLDFMRRGVRAGLPGVAMARYGNPDKRIDRVLNNAELSRGVTRWSLAAMLAIGSPLVCMIAAAQPQSQPAAPSSPAAPSTPPASFAPEASSTPSAPRAASAPQAPQSAPQAPQSAPQSPAAPQLSMARRLPFAPFLQAAQTPARDAIRRYVISYGNGSNMSGSWDSNDSPSPNELRSRYGRHFAWFRQGAHEYVITDAGVMADLEQAMEPQQDVNRLQSEVNGEQAKVNDLQHDVNRKQNDVNAIQNEVNRLQDLVNRAQSAVNQGASEETLRRLEEAIKALRESKSARSQGDVNRAQNGVNEAQSRVNEEQNKVNQLQRKVNDAQHRASNEIRDRLQEIFESAIDRRLAQQIK